MPSIGYQIFPAQSCTLRFLLSTIRTVCPCKDEPVNFSSAARALELIHNPHFALAMSKHITVFTYMATSMCNTWRLCRSHTARSWFVRESRASLIAALDTRNGTFVEGKCVFTCRTHRSQIRSRPEPYMLHFRWQRRR